MNPFNVSRKKRILKGISWLLLFVLLSTNGTLTSNVSTAYASEVSVSSNEIKVQEETDSVIEEVSEEKVSDEEEIDSEDLGSEEKDKTEGTSDKNSSKVEEGTDSSIEDEMLGEEVSDIIEDDIMDEVDDELLMENNNLLGKGGMTPFGLITDILIDKSVNVKLNGSDIVDGSTVTIADDSVFSVGVSFKVPTRFDNEDGSFVSQGDQIRLRLSDAFTVKDVHILDLRDANGIIVGQVNFETDGGITYAVIDFNGDSVIFEEGENVNCTFVADFTYNGSGIDDGDGNKSVTILNKSFKLYNPPEEITYNLSKSGTATSDGQHIDWVVAITGSSSKGGTNVSLENCEFIDDLTVLATGDYVASSFKVADTLAGLTSASAVSPDISSPNISYTFGAGNTTPKYISFLTEVPESAKNVTDPAGVYVRNEAKLKELDSTTTESGEASVRFLPPSISKSGTYNAGSGNYDPTAQEITWTITINENDKTLTNVRIKDILDAELTWKSAKYQIKDAVGNWGTAVSIGSEPSDGIYNIPGTISTEARLIIVTGVPPQGETTGETNTYDNEATLIWGSMTDSEGIPASATGVGVGYSAITKSGAISNSAEHQIDWTINVNLRGQTIADPDGGIINTFKVYDLLVHKTGVIISEADEGWPTTDLKVIDVPTSVKQKYVGFEELSSSGKLSLTKHEIKQGGEVVADLLEITGFDNDENGYSFRLTSEMTDSDIYASNSSETITNNAVLFKRFTKMGTGTDSVNYTGDLLDKVLLNRAEVSKDNASINSNNTTTSVTSGYNYQEQAAIFRLEINADGLDFSRDNLGTAVVTDTLPVGWEFTTFSGGERYLIYNASKSGSILSTSGGPLSTRPVSLADPSFTGTGASGNPNKVSFTFTNLNAPYIILVKAKPSDSKMTEYLTAGGNHSESNSLEIRMDNKPLPITENQGIRVDTKAVDKRGTLPGDGTVAWEVDYKPFGQSLSNTLKDTLPKGIDLRIDASGGLIFEEAGSRNINVYELTVGVNGTIVTPSAANQLSLDILKNAVRYNNNTRELTFTFPDATKAYRFTYITDITGSATGTITNNVELTNVTGNGTKMGFPRALSGSGSSATFQFLGRVDIKKVMADGVTTLSGAEFKIYAADGTTEIRAGESTSDGLISLKGLRNGEYILKETAAPSGYTLLNGVEYKVKIEDDPNNMGRKIAIIGGKKITVDDPLVVKNYADTDPVGTLTISKTVNGNEGDSTKEFNFRITFDPGAGSFDYIGNGVDDGTVSNNSIVKLSHGQSITILGLPVGTEYNVEELEADEDGYVTNTAGENGIIAAGVDRKASFTNTKNKPGSLTISKTVIGNGVKNDGKFDFAVALSDQINTYSYTGQGGAADGTITGDAIISLAAGESITISDLPENTTYTVSESDYSDDGYTTVKSGDTGTIKTTETSVASFTNAREVGKLTIEKIVNGNGGDKNKKFEFTVTFDGTNKSFDYIGKGISDGTITSGDTIELADGQSITIYDIPEGIKYTVTEKDYSEDGYVMKKEGDTGTILDGITSRASFTNTRNLGTLSICKTVAGNKGDKNKEFEFIVTFNKDGSYPYIGNGVEDGTIKSGDIIKLAHDQSIEIEGILEGTIYMVEEMDYSSEGYVTTFTGEIGTISHETASVAHFTNTKNVKSSGGSSNEDPDDKTPNKPSELAKFKIGEVPDPNNENSPERIIIVDDDGNIIGIYKKVQNADGTYSYVDENGVALSASAIAKTGDSMPFIPIISIILIAIAGLVALIIYKKKHSNYYYD